MASARSPGAPWKGFSLAERDRRWNAVRERAAAAGFDGILVPYCIDGVNLRLSPEQSRGARSDGRYLTQMDNAAVIVPTGGAAPIVVGDPSAANTWVTEVLPALEKAGDTWGASLARALHDAGMAHGRIGVSGLRSGRLGHVRAAEGVVSHSAMSEIRARLPGATFGDATDVIGSVRYLKSDEQVGALRRAAEIAQAGIEEMIELARPGLEATALYGRVMQRMLAMGSEYYPLALEIGPIDGERAWYEVPPLGGRLEAGDLITNETDAVVGGLIAQEDQPIVLGPVPDAWRPVIDLQQEAYALGLELMRPGATFGELIEGVNDLGARRSMKAEVMLHSRGYGNDGPLISPQDKPADHSPDLRFERNTVWAWKPHAYSADGRIMHRWGGCVLVTDRGGVPLVDREPGLVSITA